jgi:hypothetical protein
MRRPLALVVVLALAALPSPARSNGDGSPAGPPTVYERFVLSACSPCVRESYPIATLSVAPVPLPAFPRSAAASGARPGEIVIDVLRAQQMGRPDWKSLALRVTLSVSTGAGGDLFRLGTGLMDGADVRALAQAVGEMARIATAPPGEPRADTIDADFHGGTLRIGVLQIRGDAVAYVQTGDLPILLQRAVWEVPTTLYLPMKDLPGVATALGQAAARIEQVRGN